MKKRFTLMLLAALVAVTSFAQDVKQRQIAPSQMVTKTLQATPSIKPFQAISKAQVAKTTALKAKKAPKKAGLSDVEWPLTALTCGYAYELDDSYNLVECEVPYTAAETTIDLVDMSTVSVVGLYPGADGTITATLNLDELSFEIAPGQTLMTTDYGSVILTNVEDSSAPLTGQFNEDGTISINELWCGVLGDDAGDYAGYTYTNIYYTPMIVQPNGHMDFTTSSGAQSVPVYVYQDPARGEAMVFNFAGEATGAIVNVAEDGTTVIKTQPLSDYTDWGYGVFYTYAADSDGATTENITGVVDGSVLTFDTGWTLTYWRSSTQYVWFGCMTETTITLNEEEWEVPVIEDVAAMPADPEVVLINPYNAESGYGSVAVHIPNVDVDGFLLKESKLYYRIYGQKDGEVTLLEYTPDLYINLTETMSTIPYTFDDNYDFQTRGDNKYVFLNFDFDYDTMGVQSVYYGGDEENATEIIWYYEEPSEFTEAQWVASEQGYENTEEVTDITISEEDGITGLFAQAGNTSNSPKYYNTGSAVRMYAGNTLTITSEEYPIEKIELILGSRVDIELASEEGEFTVDTENSLATWEGEANEVVFDVPQGLKPAGQAYIAGINVYYAAEEKEPELTELPDGAEVQEWIYDTYIEDTDEETGETYLDLAESTHIHVAFVGDQVYFQGLNADTEDSWVVGTLEDGVITVPANEYLGYSSYYYYQYSAFVEVFAREMTLTYDAENNKITSRGIGFDYFYNGTAINELAYDYAEMYLVPEIPGTPETPEVTGVNLAPWETDYPWIALDIPTVTTDGNEMILDNVFYTITIKDKDGEMFNYVFKADDYGSLDEDMTQMPYNYTDEGTFYDIYKGGARVYVYGYDFTTWQQIWVQTTYYTSEATNFSEYGIYDLTDYWEAVGINDVAAKDVKSVKYFDLQGRQATADTKGVVIAVKTMSDGTTKTQKMLRK